MIILDTLIYFTDFLFRKKIQRIKMTFQYIKAAKALGCKFHMAQQRSLLSDFRKTLKFKAVQEVLSIEQVISKYSF